MKFEIKHRFSGSVLFSLETESLKLCVEAAVKSGADLRGANLYGADLYGADLSWANLSEADLYGADLSWANLYGANLSWANLSGADLYGANLSGAALTRANLTGADLSEAYLYGANLYGADLYGANLSGAALTRANLTGADLKKIKGWDETPKLKNLNSRILKAIKKDGELEMGSWHKCNTTHCRGGWAVILAGKKGKALEDKFGVFLAATLIYLKSTGRIPDFFATNRAAMADLKKCAKAEK